MVAIKGHFDGRVIVPDEPLDLPAQQRVIVHVQPVGDAGQGATFRSNGVAGAALLQFAGLIPADDLRLMEAAIRDACERVDADAW